MFGWYVFGVQIPTSSQSVWKARAARVKKSIKKEEERFSERSLKPEVDSNMKYEMIAFSREFYLFNQLDMQYGNIMEYSRYYVKFFCVFFWRGEGNLNRTNSATSNFEA